MGNAVIGGQLHHLRVHHDKAHVLRAGFIQQADDQGVGADGFAGAGGAGNQHVGQPGDVAHNVLVADVSPHREGHGGAVLQEGAGLDHIPDQHRGNRLVGHLDAHHGDLVRNRRDPDAACPQGQSDVVRQIGHLVQLHALLQRKFVPGNGWSADHVPRRGVHAEAAQGVRQPLGVDPQLRACFDVVVAGVHIQQVYGRIVVLAAHRHAAGNLRRHQRGGLLHIYAGFLFPPRILGRRVRLPHHLHRLRCRLRQINGIGHGYRLRVLADRLLHDGDWLRVRKRLRDGLWSWLRLRFGDRGIGKGDLAGGRRCSFRLDRFLLRRAVHLWMGRLGNQIRRRHGVFFPGPEKAGLCVLRCAPCPLRLFAVQGNVYR